MTDYKGPERRAVITFTREDSDRLVRLEQQLESADTKMDAVLESIAETNKKIAAQNVRISKLERMQSWVMGIGTAVTFAISTAVLYLSGHHL